MTNIFVFLIRLHEQPEEVKVFAERRVSILPPQETAITTESVRNAPQISTVIDRDQENESRLNSAALADTVPESVDSKLCLYKHDSKDELEGGRGPDDDNSKDAAAHAEGDTSVEQEPNQYHANINQSQAAEAETPQVYSSEQESYQPQEGNYQDPQYYYGQNNYEVSGGSHLLDIQLHLLLCSPIYFSRPINRIMMTTNSLNSHSIRRMRLKATPTRTLRLKVTTNTNITTIQIILRGVLRTFSQPTQYFNRKMNKIIKKILPTDNKILAINRKIQITQPTTPNTHRMVTATPRKPNNTSKVNTTSTRPPRPMI